MSRRAALLILALWPTFVACKTPPPEPLCRTVETESGTVTECRDNADAEWTERTRKEAEEDMEQRGPERRH